MNPKGAVFQPELIELMKSVLDDATIMLPEAKRTSAMKAQIASHILTCAASGEREVAQAPALPDVDALTWTGFEQNRVAWLNLISVEDFRRALSVEAY